VAKDAVVPTINANNPVLADLKRHGVTRDVFTALWIKGEKKTWGELAATDNATPVVVYTRSDACGAAETWALYLGGKQEDLQGTAVFGDPGLAAGGVDPGDFRAAGELSRDAGGNPAAGVPVREGGPDGAIYRAGAPAEALMPPRLRAEGRAETETERNGLILGKPVEKERKLFYNTDRSTMFS
jgi:hypothetical protein